MEIQCVRQSAAMIEDKSEVKITPPPTPIPPNLSTQPTFIKPSQPGPKGASQNPGVSAKTPRIYSTASYHNQGD